MSATLQKQKQSKNLSFVPSANGRRNLAKSKWVIHVTPAFSTHDSPWNQKGRIDNLLSYASCMGRRCSRLRTLTASSHRAHTIKTFLNYGCFLGLVLGIWACRLCLLCSFDRLILQSFPDL